MHLEQIVNYQLNKFPEAKKTIKKVYQHVMVSISPKFLSEGVIVPVFPNNPSRDFFFGYYDKSPWDATGQYILCLSAKDTWSEPDPKKEAELIIIDTTKGNSFRKIGITHSWNVQQGCMLQWLGPDYSSKIIYNDIRNGNYSSVIQEIVSGNEVILPMPVYTVSEDGSIALSLDFSRLHNLRPGYGYSAIAEKTKGSALPDVTCIWKIDIHTGEVVPLFKYTDFASFQPRPEMLEKGSIHKVNHLMISPNGKRFMVLYRWFCGQRKYTRLITCNIDGSDMYLLSDDDMVSHCYWKNNEEIIAFCNKHNSGTGYYLMKDRTQEYQHLWPSLCNDGHPSYCPTNNNLVVIDTYPDRKRIQEIKIAKDTDLNGKEIIVLARVFAPFKYDNDTRCDLHPRWSRDGKKICFDACFEGHRGLYVVNVE